MRSKLKEMREAAGFTQQDLAVKVGLQSSQISRLERGITKPLNMTVRTMLSMADALGLPFAEFIEILQNEEEEN